MKKYLHCLVTTHSGRIFENPLMLKEVGLISKLAQENQSVRVSIDEISKGTYNLMFNCGVRHL